MANLSLTDLVQEKARLGSLDVEIKILNSVLSFSTSVRPLLALLSFFANIKMTSLPKLMLTNVFKSLVVCQDEGVWHRALFILTDYIELQEIELSNS
jgi:hypothetical protein